MLRKTRWTVALALAAPALLGLGCAGDVARQAMGDPAVRARVMDMIGADREAAGSMLDRLLDSDSTRAMVVERLVGDPGGARVVMEAVAKNRSLLTGTMDIAAQDSAMRMIVLIMADGISIEEP